MAVVLKWKADGDYLSGFRSIDGKTEATWTPSRTDAMRFDSRAKLRSEVARHLGCWPACWGLLSKFVRLVPKRRAEPEKVACLSEPTARDAVAGMLLRHGFDGWAGALVRGASPAEAAKQLGPASPVDGVRPEHAACIAALKALARGDLRGARDHQDLFSAIERLTRERDEARAEAAAFRVCLDSETRRAREQGATEMRSTAARRIDDELRGMGAGNPAKTTLLRMYNRIWNIPVSAQEDASLMSVVSEAPTDVGMRIERRGDGEYLVGHPGCNTCEERSPCGDLVCTAHLDGQHISEGEEAPDGAFKIDARWPIEASK